MPELIVGPAHKGIEMQARRIDQCHEMVPIPIRTGVRMSVASRIDSESTGGISAPRGVQMFIVANDMIAIFRKPVLVTFGSRQRSGSLIHRFREPRWIADETFVFRAHAMSVPTTDVPRIIGVEHHLCDFTRWHIGARILFPVHAVVDADAVVTSLKIGDGAGVVTFHVMFDVELFAYAGSVPMAAASLPPNGRAIIGTRR